MDLNDPFRDMGFDGNHLSMIHFYYHLRVNISTRFSSNSEANASENLEEMFPWYYIDSYVIRRFKPSTTCWYVTSHKWVKHIIS